MFEYLAGLATAGVAGALAYGDLRAKIGKLEGKMDMISQNITVILNNSKNKK